jgi:CDP-glycerol glycerophosphotransferase (TagB/SpsB family)
VKLARFRKAKAACFSLNVEYRLIQKQQYYEKQVMLRRDHIQERKDKKEEVKKMNISDVLSIQE